LVILPIGFRHQYKTTVITPDWKLYKKLLGKDIKNIMGNLIIGVKIPKGTPSIN
jgi:hypothetical protein